jgi:hypothetical protein
MHRLIMSAFLLCQSLAPKEDLKLIKSSAARGFALWRQDSAPSGRSMIPCFPPFARRHPAILRAELSKPEPALAADAPQAGWR